MRLRQWKSGVLLVGLIAACADQGPDPGLDGGTARGGHGASSIRGRVFTIRFVPDSSYAPVAGARVSLYYVDSIPSDTTGVPPDSTMVPLTQFMAMLDSFPQDTLRPEPPLPPDTLPTDTIPPDTIPTDTNPPPPPPPVGCGRTGELVAVVESSREGTFGFRGLRAGKYDLVVRADSARGLSGGYYCGVHLLEGQQAEVRVFVPSLVRFDGWARR